MKPRSVVNILFLGGAKRVAMGRLFMAAAKKRGLECNIFSSEISRNVPISCIGPGVEADGTTPAYTGFWNACAGVTTLTS